MDPRHIHEAAHYFLEARQTGRLIEALPPHCRPANSEEALAIQDETLAHMRDPVGGWKTGPNVDGGILRGAILSSRIFQSPARIPASLVPLRGIEGEIAFRFDKALPPRAEEYSQAEIEKAVTALVAIEIVDSRFADYGQATPLDKAADCVSNGGFVAGTELPNWRSLDLSHPEVVVTFDGEEVPHANKGHPRGNPAAPMIELANELRKTTGVPKGAVITTGSYSGIQFAKPGQKVSVEFKGLGKAEAEFTA